MTIAVDFDGTIVEHRYPRIGEEIPFAVETLKLLQQEKHRLILWSVREGERDHQGFSRKLKADLFIDDRNVGGIPDWGIIYEMIKEKKTFADIYSQQREENSSQKKKRKWLPF